ncbi:hypothetical protein P7V44_21775 [Providencia sp. CRE-3FA-0001]|uniref:Uncharacterized protein n=1 Tax=Providencia huashanensis TaxID=3037798 RepID=A0AA42FR17_9GAMM|nr:MULTISPECIES: hypothetical protein [unclassified Providencia]MDG4698857.1 hypothetical protein [Providencia sp. CRE-3FA-0001]
MNVDEINTDLILLVGVLFTIIFFVGGLLVDEFSSKKSSNIFLIVMYIIMFIGIGFLVSWGASVFTLMFTPILYKYIKQNDAM